MNIKPSKTVRCMSHTNTDTVKRQRESKGGQVSGEGQREFCWPSFGKPPSPFHDLESPWQRLVESLKVLQSPSIPKTEGHTRSRTSAFLRLAFEYIRVVGVPQGSNIGTPKFCVFFFFVTLRHEENQFTADANTLIISTWPKSSIARRVRLVNTQEYTNWVIMGLREKRVWQRESVES